jgi:UDP-glucose:tetrahydrobiopterin glucosyltransferase
MPHKILVLSTSVAPLGSGGGGGVELTLQTITQELSQRSHQIQVIAPQGSTLGNVPILETAGELQTAAQTQGASALIAMPNNAVLANMWDYARTIQDDYDLLFNIAYDWLPFYLTPFFHRPIAHWVSMGSLSQAMDDVIGRVALDFPGTIAVYTKAQAATFPFADRCYPLGSALDLALYEFCAQPEPNVLGWVGRISPEKGLEDAVDAAQQLGMTLRIFGVIQDHDYWQWIRATYPDAPIEYKGFLKTQDLQAQLRVCRSLLVTSRWVEAFGNVAIEALACGVPVIAYRRGGLAEIVREGQSGLLVEPDSVSGLVRAIAQLDSINRRSCRQQAEDEYSLAALGDRVERWFQTILDAAAF